MKTNVVVRNTSRYPNHVVRWLVQYAADYVRSEMDRMGSLATYSCYGFYVEFKNKQHASYSGLYHHQLVNERGGYPVGVDMHLRKVLVKIGAPERFPLHCWDHRYKEAGPEGDLRDWEEAAVAIAAHEFSHVKYSGSKEGEHNCDTIMHDAVDAFRRDRANYERFLFQHEAKELVKHETLAAKKSPEAVASTALRKAEGMLAVWTRKRKLAQTKEKQYQREVTRTQKRLTVLTQPIVQPITEPLV